MTTSHTGVTTTTYREVVPTRDLQRFLSSLRREGYFVVQSSPVSAGYQVIYRQR